MLLHMYGDLDFVLEALTVTDKQGESELYMHSGLVVRLVKQRHLLCQ